MHRLLSLIFVSAALGADLIVDLPDGTIRGSEITYDNKSYYAYRGIPFAAPPLGKLRFQAPVSPQPWDGILEANQTSSCCISMSPSIEEDRQDEDCLYLNVYTPPRKITEKLPVMVMIYGGGCSTGCTSDVSSGPYYLIDQDLIIVYFNYRVGLYGFLSTQDDVVLGNAGLKDQLLAMKWTKNNIALFGGDPEQITLFGLSAGAISVGAHIVNTKSAGLYRAAICQSGCSLTYIDITNQNDSKKAAYDYAKYVDPTISEKNTTKEIRDFLQSVPADVLTPAFNANKETGLVIEVEHEDAYVTNRSFPLLESGNFVQVPLILGTASAEALTFFAFTGGIPIIVARGLNFDLNPSSLLPWDLELLPGVDVNEVASIIKEAYVVPNGSFVGNLAAVVELVSDQMFVKSTLKQAELQSNFTPVYLYQFSFEGYLTSFLPYIEGTGRAGHGEEDPYIFASMPLLTDREVLVSQQMVKLWANFAKTLNPTPDASDPLFNLTWPQVTPTNIQYLDFDDQIALKPNRKEKEMAMWNYVYYTYGQQPFKGF